jgi:UDP-N-acetyl-D-glucosamine/UDP-N-acetyl-D-galactosamine dehydrogenase
MQEKIKIAIIGLGYVGLPLCMAFSKYFETIGFDINNQRVKSLNKKIDYNNEYSKKDLKLKNKAKITNELSKIRNCNFYIISVPTPIKKNYNPDFSATISASKIIASILKKNDIVVYESTVYPGATDEIFIPILEKHSNLKANKDFFFGYSPERINPGDKTNTLNNITKIISGSNKKITKKIDNIYSRIIKKTFIVKNVRTAEAAKIIENTQRDINIALMNEIEMYFNSININTKDAINAAATKWNFQRYYPGLVGGHCIGVDPYYLTYKMRRDNFNPKIILAGRQINDNMGKYVAKRLISKMKKKSIKINKAKILILGFSYKEDCTDVRNTKVIDIVNFLKKNKCIVTVYDPIANASEALKKYKINIKKIISHNINYDAILIAVKHKLFLKNNFQIIKKNLKSSPIIYDLHSVLDKKTINRYL